MAETLNDILEGDAKRLTERARKFTKADVEKIFHGKMTAKDVSVNDVKSVYKVAVRRTNANQPMFCFTDKLKLDEGTANCHTCY